MNPILMEAGATASGVVDLVKPALTEAANNAKEVITSASPIIFGVAAVSVAIAVAYRWLKKIRG